MPFAVNYIVIRTFVMSISMLGRVFIVRINKAMLTLSGVRFEESVTSKDIDI